MVESTAVAAENGIPESFFENTASEIISAAIDKILHISIMISICLPISIILFCYVLPQQWKYDKSSGMHYLESDGFGAAIWGILFLVLPLILYLASKKEVSEEPIKLPRPILKLPNELSPEDFKLVFGNSPSCLRILQFLIILTRFAGNMAYISYNFWNLPRRDPAERLNQAKHIVVWVESLTIFFACLTVTNLLLWMAGKKLCGKTLHRLCQWLKGLGKFSVLLSLKYFNPMNMIDFMKKMQKKSAHKVVWELFLIAMCVPTAILSIMIKIAQVDFITEKFYWDWTIWNWFALAGFINNLASLITNKDKVQIDAIFLFITANDVESPEKWHAALGDALYEQYGKGGLILMSCVNAEDVGILLNTRSCLESSDRLFELVPQSGCQQLALR